MRHQTWLVTDRRYDGDVLSSNEGGVVYLGIRELWFARGRFLLVGAVIVLVALLTTMLSGLANGLVDDGISGLRRLPATNLVFQKGAAETFSRSTLTDKELAGWKDIEGVEASPLGVSFVNARTASGKTVDVALYGVPEGSFLAPNAVAESALEGRPGLVLADEFKEHGIEVGDQLTIVGVDEQLPVLGFTYAGSYGHVDIAFTSLKTWQELLYGSNAKGRFSAIALKGPAEKIASASSRLDQSLDTETVTKDEAYNGSPGYAGETQTMTMIRSFLLVISALIVGAFFIVWTMQRSKQLALLKAMGASRSYIVRDSLGQLTIVLLVATVLGGFLAFALGALVGRSAVPFRLELAPALTSLALLVCVGLLGCLAGIRRVTSVDPAMALRSAD